MTIAFHKLDPAMESPSRAHDTDGGVDLRTSEDFSIEPGERRVVPTGISIAVPAGFGGFVLPRSGLAAKHGIGVVNAPGLVDADYRGEVKVILVNHGNTTFSAERGERIAQLVVMPVVLDRWVEVDELPDTVRGSGGFGSSGAA